MSQDPLPGPRISVVLIAHNRREFLDEALRSVGAQTLERSRFDAVLVTNFQDPKIEALCRELGIRTVLSASDSTGCQKMVEGIEATRGEVLTFLDYDDRYLPERLRFVAEQFGRDPELGFLRNGLEFLDEHGPLPVDRLPLSLRLMAERGRRRLVQDPEKATTNPRMGFARPEFNVGTMAVRRSIVDRTLPYLRRLSFSGDSYLYHAAWASRSSLLFDPLPLTAYRVHTGNLTLVRTVERGARTAPQDAFREARARDYRVLLEMAAASKRPELLRDLQTVLLCDRIFDGLDRPSFSRREAFQLLLDMVRGAGGGLPSVMQLHAAAGATGAALLPALGRRLHALTR